MQITIGTNGGLARVGEDGVVNWLRKGDVRATDGRWAIVDGNAIASVDESRLVARTELPLLCLASTRSSVLVGTAEARLIELSPGTSATGIVESFDRIPTRDQWYTPWGGPPDTRSITVTGDGDVLVNVHVGGVWRINGGNELWKEVVDVDCDTHQVLATADDATVVAAAAVGYGQSDDAGHTFRWTTAGLHDTYCRAAAVADDIVLVSASTGPFTRHAALYMRPLDAEVAFVRCDKGLPEWFEDNIDTFQLSARGSEVALGTEAGRLFVSQDAGASWELLADGLGAIRAVAVS